ncbi:MAG: helix-hairpin-helix domain-containing protein, partial [Draconibacterium sp.]|nr:helix-hairpin-helix domain-containing protein [Draconibacterium sp.]
YVSVAPVVEVETAVAEQPVEVVAEAPVVEAPVAEPVEAVEEKVEVVAEAAPVAEPVEAKEEAPAKKAAPKRAETKGDNLTKLAGVGPKLAEILAEGGFTTYASIASAKVEDIKKVLEAAGSRYASKDPQPWIEEAKGLA